jgi:hypothetical protein
VQDNGEGGEKHSNTVRRRCLSLYSANVKDNRVWQEKKQKKRRNKWKNKWKNYNGERDVSRVASTGKQ